VIEEHHLEELKHATHEEALHDLGHETDTEDQVSNFLHCCLRLLNDPDVAKVDTDVSYLHGGTRDRETISSPLPERDLCQVSKKKCTGREFKMTT
jgi:hypothetical protein